MRRLLPFFLIAILLSAQGVAAEVTRDEKRSASYEDLFTRFFDQVVNNDGSIDQSINVGSDIYTGLTSGLSIATLVKLFDLYGDTEFLDTAEAVSDFLATSLNDPRYPLIATYYDSGSKITSNFRSVIDNFLIAWGLSELSERIDPEDELARKIQEERSDFVKFQLESFSNDIGFVEELRVDRTTSSNVFTVYTNLMAAFIITESQSPVFNLFSDKPEEIFDYVDTNARTEDGGINTRIFNGFSDDLITLRNTALYANLAMNLYRDTNDVTYLNKANQSMQFIQQEFYDIGVTGGYFETLEDGSPVQQSKSLFSHALLLQLLLRLANLGDEDARLNLLAVWRTISNYFRDDYYFFSSLDRGGDQASASISTVDNLMMIYSMSSLPLFSLANYTRTLEFRDQLVFDLDVQVPSSLSSNLVISLDDDIVHGQVIQGEEETQRITVELTPERPSGDSESYDYFLSLSSEGVFTDWMLITVTVSLAPGLDLSLGVISVFSVMAVVIFVLFMRRYGETPQV